MASIQQSESAHEGATNHLGSHPLLPLSRQPGIRRAGGPDRLHAANPHRQRRAHRLRHLLAARRGMRTLLAAGLVLLAAGVLSAQPAGRWLFGSTGRGTARWTEDTAGLTYRGGAPFGWAVLQAVSLTDGFVQARFKPISGREGQAGGVVWRWREADNYYVARANALENNVVAYKVVRCRRTHLTPVGAAPGTYGVKVPVPTGAWHTLRVDFTGAQFEITYDGRHLFAVRDDTFRDAGLVGIWS